MDKAKAFLEKNVQWLVLGLAGIVFLLMVWWYVVQPPVVVPVAGKELTPGEIDAATVSGPVSEYKRKKDQAATTIVKIDQVQFVGPFKEKMDPSRETAVALLDKGGKTTIPLGVVEPERDPTQIVQGGGDKVDQLPVLPAATYAAANNGRSVAVVPDPTKVKKPAVAQGARGAVAEVATTQVNKDWVSISFKVPGKEIGDAFHKVFDKYEELPPSVWETAIVHIELHREERGADGKWGNHVIVKPLSNLNQPPFPADQIKDQQKLLEYVEWVTQHAEQVAQPPFYEIAKGDQWVAPGSDVSTTAGDRVPRQPRQPMTPMMPPGYPPGYGGGYGGYGGMRPGYPPGYGGMRPGGYGGYGGYPPGYGGGPARPGGRRGAGYAPNDTGRPIELAQAAPGYPPGYGGGYGGYPPGYGGGYGARPGYPPGYGGGYGGYPYPGMMPPGMMPPGAMGPQAVPGGFNVNNLEQALEVWAHDDSVQDGKTYHYAIKYRIRNPLYETNLGKTKDMNQLFALQSPLSNWSDPVKISAKVNFFVLGTQGADSARFEVYTQEPGRVTRKQVKASPGDQIPETTWTLVDVRREGKDEYVLLVNQGGQVVRRDRASDQKNPEYQRLRGEADSSKATAAADR